AGVTHADVSIFTADNPRSEDPNAILKDMQIDLTCEEHYKVIIEPDRKSAIRQAVQMAGENDIVVILGKGHETYQEINGVRHDFDDAAVLAELLNS
ncbi:MAG: UDP-N-acetylmuramoyl-L-alanyl-D-glutamate--2,6-diaminopimelate ligase, partial [Moraxella sp.]|nr:UDP-N-acetylmuramoyl-L-alanyl-D-glutamate--2,6-diaminopimelate ligase [Moraxella sp.]